MTAGLAGVGMAVPLGESRHALIMAISRLYVGCIEQPAELSRSERERERERAFMQEGNRAPVAKATHEAGATFVSELQGLSLPIDGNSDTCLHRRGSPSSLRGKRVSLC